MISLSSLVPCQIRIVARPPPEYVAWYDDDGVRRYLTQEDLDQADRVVVADRDAWLF